MAELTIDAPRLPSTVSYSQLSSWLHCQKAFQLERVIRVPRQPAMWFPAGTTFHHITEQYDRNPDGGKAKFTAPGYVKQMLDKFIADESTLPLDQWQVGKAVKEKKQWPDGENYTWWQNALPHMISQYIDWRLRTKWPILDVDGTLAIELPVDLHIGGYQFRGVIDRVFVPNGQVMVCDLKTSKREPEKLQLAIYANALHEQFGIDCEWGCFYNARGGDNWSPRMVTAYTSGIIAKMVTDFRWAVEADVFIPNESMMCGTCSVREYCAVVGGEKAAQYDPLFGATTVAPHPSEIGADHAVA